MPTIICNRVGDVRGNVKNRFDRYSDFDMHIERNNKNSIK